MASMEDSLEMDKAVTTTHLPRLQVDTAPRDTVQGGMLTEMADLKMVALYILYVTLGLILLHGILRYINYLPTMVRKLCPQRFRQRQMRKDIKEQRLHNLGSGDGGCGGLDKSGGGGSGSIGGGEPFFTWSSMSQHVGPCHCRDQRHVPKWKLYWPSDGKNKPLSVSFRELGIDPQRLEEGTLVGPQKLKSVSFSLDDDEADPVEGGGGSRTQSVVSSRTVDVTGVSDNREDTLQIVVETSHSHITTQGQQSAQIQILCNI